MIMAWLLARFFVALAAGSFLVYFQHTDLWQYFVLGWVCLPIAYVAHGVERAERDAADDARLLARLTEVLRR